MPGIEAPASSRGPARPARPPLNLRLTVLALAPVLGVAIGVGVLSARLLVRLAEEPAGTSAATLLLILALSTAAIAAVAGLAAVLFFRSLARPLVGLAAAARRIGGGDLATPVPVSLGDEAAHLAATMEEMRSRLMHLTIELRRREAEAQALLDGIVEGVFSVDEQRRIRYMNPQAAQHLGVDAAQAIGRFCGDVLRPVDIDGQRPCDSRCPIVHARSRDSTRATEELQLPNGRRIVVITSSPPAGGQQVQVFRDETDVEGLRRARDAIVANISHEFRTPLSAQLASLELLRGQMEASDAVAPPSTGEKVLDLVRSVERGSLRLVQLVDNLLESVRLESGEDSIRRGTVNLDEVVEEAVELVGPLVRQRDQTIQVDLPYPLTPVEGDGPRLIQVVVNLLANASKYAPDGTTVWVGGSVDPGSVRVWVEDEGPGLPAGEEGSIFGRFYRGERADGGGMGLGLSIVKSIVERHGGTVRADSRPEGGGRFTVSLPTKDAP